MSKLFFRIMFVSVSILLLNACGSMGANDDEGGVLSDRRIEYKKQKQASLDLEIPPDLTRSTIKEGLVIPGQGADSATYSEYVKGRGNNRVSSGGSSHEAILPQVDEISVRREGDTRWLVVSASADTVWPRVVEFWRENGILLVEENPSIGIMQTDWIENRADIKGGFLTETLRKVVDGLYASSTRDQYRTRLERGQQPGTTEIYLTHSGMEEKLIASSTRDDSDRDILWVPRASDPELEAEMLARLMVFMGVSEAKVKREVAKQEKAQPKSQMQKTADGYSALLIQDDFARAWRRAGVALDQVGFVVEDRDRSQGIYYVRYHDPIAVEEKKGFFTKLFSSKDEKSDTEDQYQLKLTDEGQVTRATVLDAKGERSQSETAERILTLLHEKIR